MSCMQKEGNCEKYQKELLEIENTVTEMKAVFDVLISTHEVTKKRIDELEDMSMGNIQN